MKSLFCFSLCIFLVAITFAQEQVNIRDTQVQINTIGGNEVFVMLMLDLKEDYQLWEEVFFEKNEGLSYTISSIAQKELTAEAETLESAETGLLFIGFRFNTNSALMTRIIEGEADYYIEISDTIHIFLINTITGEKDSCILTPDQVKEHTRNAIILSDEEQEELIQSKGGEINIISNSIDFGLIPGDESSSGKTEYYLDFGYRTNYGFIKKAPIFFETSGHVSTNSRDSLNYLKIFPLSCNYMKNRHEIACLIGSESNQVFTEWRISADINYKQIIGNFINLTYGVNRLRLKPIIQAGFKGYGEILNSRPPGSDGNVFSLIAYMQGYYYIPIYKLYSLTFEGNIFYDTSKEVNPHREPKYLYSITAGVEIPNSGIKTIFKYSNGVVDVFDAENTSIIMIGLLADILGK